jgi:hypothetical protein
LIAKFEAPPKSAKAIQDAARKLLQTSTEAVEVMKTMTVLHSAGPPPLGPVITVEQVRRARENIPANSTGDDDIVEILRWAMIGFLKNI